MNNKELILSLGSNLGDRFKNLKDAIILLNQELFQNNKSKCSSIFQTKALLPQNSPSSWDLDYYNMCVRGTCSMDHKSILVKIKKIEKQLGRDLNSPRWSPRVIDIDILAYGDLHVQTSTINIPHLEILNRSWCLLPFAEIYPEWTYNIKNQFFQKSICEIIKLIDLKTIGEIIKTELKIDV